MPPPQASAQDLYGDSSKGQVVIENSGQEYDRVIGLSEASGNELKGGSVQVKELISAFRIFGAEHDSGSTESVAVTENSAEVADVKQNASQEMLYLGGASVIQMTSTANITAKLNKIKITGTVTSRSESGNSLNIFGAQVSSQVSDPSAEVLAQGNSVFLDGVNTEKWTVVGITGGSGYSKEGTPIVLSDNTVDINGSNISAGNYVRIEGASHCCPN